MLTSDDLKKIKVVVKDTIQPLERKVEKISEDVEKIGEDVEDLKLETKAIHVIIERQDKDLTQRIDRLEKEVGISPSP